MNNHEVTIKVCVSQQGKLNFTYQPSVLHTSPGDTVVWLSPDGPFAIEFKADTPGHKVGAHSDEFGKQWRSAQFAIRQDARGHYHYAVAVALNSREFDPPAAGRIALDAACPEIIVN